MTLKDREFIIWVKQWVTESQHGTQAIDQYALDAAIAVEDDQEKETAKKKIHKASQLIKPGEVEDDTDHQRDKIDQQYDA